MTTADLIMQGKADLDDVYAAGYEKGKAEGGEKTNIVVTKEPTCIEEGEATFVCSCCGAVGTDVIPIIDHAYVDGMCTMCGVKDPDYINSYPVTDTLLGLYDLGGTEDATLVNHAPEPHANTADEVLSGTYEMADNYVGFSGAANSCRMHTQLQNDLTKKVTFVALFSVPDGNRVIIGNRYAGTAPAKFGLTLMNDRVRFGANGEFTAESYPSAINSDNFAILALTADSNGCRVVRFTDGALTTLAEYSGAIEPWSANNTCIGGDSTSNSYSTARIALAAIHEGDMSDAQLESVCAFVSSYGRYKGLTIE